MCPYEDSTESNNEEYKSCPANADFILCYPSIQANETIKLACPFLDAYHVVDKNGKPILIYENEEIKKIASGE